MLTIPFANPMGPNSGPLSDGIIFGALPQLVPASVLTTIGLASPTRVLRGNADAGGSLTYSDVTVAAGDDVASDVSLFDTVNPTQDRLCIDLDAIDEIDGITLLVGTAAILTGVPVADVFYKGISGWVSATSIVTPSLASAGAKTISFSPILASNIVLTDDLVDPRNSVQRRCVYVQFSGITGVTTAPLFTRIWKRRVPSIRPYQDRTSLFTQTANHDFTGQAAEVLPVAGDVFLWGFDEKTIRILPTVFRTRPTTDPKEWVYSKADGTFAALTGVTDPSSMATAALNTAPYTSRNLTSTLATGTWGTSGTFSDVGIAGNGYVEFKHGPTATLAHMVGLSITNDGGDNYTGIDYAWHGGHGGGALCSVWSNGVQQSGTFALAGGDTLRIERVGTEMRFSQNGVLRYTMTGVPAGTYKIDSTFISLSTVNEIKLVDTSKGYDIPVAFAWASANLVTQTTTTLNLPTATAYRIDVTPPADWGKLSLTDSSSVAHNRYWVGWRNTAATANISFPVTRGAPIVLVQNTGHASQNLGDGAVYAS